LADPKAERGSSQVFAVATAPDRSWTAIGVAWNRPDGAVQVMLADYRPGNAWVKSRLVELRQAWGGVVVADTASRGLIEEAHEPSKTDQAEAHNAFYDLVMADRVRHGNERALNTAVRGSRWRDLGGDTRQLDRKGDTENSPLVAVGLAAWALLTLPPAGPPEYHSWDDIERLADEDADDPR
jgi:hypothetical protein